MRIFIEHDAAALARLTGAPRPTWDGIIIEHGDASNVLAIVQPGNPLAGDWLYDLEAPGSRIVAWSGTMAPNFLDRDPRTWGRPGREAFDRFCDEVAEQLKHHERRVCFHPHARHVLNDVPSCLSFLRNRATQPFDIALAPASLLEPSMLDRLEDHLERQFESLGGRCAMVMAHDIRGVGGDNDQREGEPTELGKGVLPRDLTRSLLRQHVSPETPIVIDGRQGSTAIARQVEWLAG